MYYCHRVATQLQLTNIYHISYHIVSYIITYHIISYHIKSYFIISYHIISYNIISYHIISYHIISYHIISYHIISYHIDTVFCILPYCNPIALLSWVSVFKPLIVTYLFFIVFTVVCYCVVAEASACTILCDNFL